MLLMIDNYDSFTFNLVQYLAELGAEVRVVRNDEITVEEVEAMRPDHLVLSPGPCSPAQAGVCVPAVRRLAGKLPILGVCLGHQSIGAAMGASVVRAGRQMHGKTSVVEHDGRGVYRGLPPRPTVVRYHSLAIDPATMPKTLEVVARADDGEIMGVRGRALPGGRAPLEGVQFHPESILSEHGHAILRNFLEPLPA